MTAVRIPPLAGGQARIRLVYQANHALQVLGFEGPEWATAYENLDLTAEQVVELTPTADIATNDGSATCYLITATTTGQRGWSCCVQVPDSGTEVELVTLVGAAAIDPADILAGRLLPTPADLDDGLWLHTDGGEWVTTPAHAHEGTAIVSTGETGGTKFLREDGDGTSSWQTPAGITDHGALSGLTDDDHTGYALLAGRATGQTIIGGTAVGDALTLQGTSGNGTASAAAIVAKVGNNGGTTAITVLNDGKTGIGTATPLRTLHVASTEPQLFLQYANNVHANVFVGATGALHFDFTGDSFGLGSGALNLNAEGGGNCALGFLALASVTDGSYNLAIGNLALSNLTEGFDNVAIGDSCLASITTGGSNCAIGTAAAGSITTSSSNIAIGRSALNKTTTGNNNVACGDSAGLWNTTGAGNVFFGYGAGRFHANGTSWLRDPENSIYIGATCRGKDNADSNSIVIGYGSIGLGANTTVIGNSSTTQTKLFGSLGVGPDTPAHTLHVSNGVTATNFGLYNTYTNDSNYERLSIGWSGNVCTIAPEALGTGTLRGLNIGGAASLVGLFGVTPIVQPASADQAVVTLGNTNSEIGGLTISAGYDQTEVQALRDKCEELADDVRALSTLVHSLRTALVNLGAIKGAA